ncbi:MAE_28990/MAE_18760 family HEPN-like nuclease [Sphingopyxis sp. JAI108]|uniref:MAE_28990/MAE_18760 family HEPN-like nuclease n=1 Tax=Sphingopyxis sp. JAI108 TaxID=2723060 RepID=UPI0015CE43DB|nr:MAE_28990/MAE_18760 family HEPN-like nuclease [Sphingopyxis sp. JAI108]NYF33795.1 hypothetical protein [Sphingopyxis sp. JAI108]
MTPTAEIERDLDWREAELAVLRLLITNNEIGEREKFVLFRAAWALLYAHYEGFCKFALTVYYDAIKVAGKCHGDLPSKMQALALDKKVKDLRSLPTIDLISKMRSFEVDLMKAPADFPDVNTESNLWPKTLESLIEDADLIVPTLQLYNRSLATLVSRRNKIAHGERDIIPELSYYIGFENSVLNLMYDLALSIDEKLGSI